MKVHELKTIPPYFDAIQFAGKRFELRKNDRDFEQGDLLILKEYYPEKDSYSGDELVVRIQYILEEFTGLDHGYCILSISDPI